MIAIGTILSSRTLIWGLFPALMVLIITMVLGRVFCGWVCPMGTIIDLNDKWFHRRHKRSKIDENSGRFRRIKYFILGAVLAAALFSVQLYWFFDPLALLTRSFTLFVFPAFVQFVNGVFDVLFRTGLFEDGVYRAWDFLQSTIVPLEHRVFVAALPVLLIFIVILVLSRVSRRFWCRNLCPLGALLGIFSKYRLVDRYVNDTCTGCGVCRSCRMNAVEDDYTDSLPSECIVCGECVDDCPAGSVRFRFGFRKTKSKIDFSRRSFINAGITGLAASVMIRILPGSKASIAAAIRPPGALPEAELLDRCARCQECVRVCSTTGGCLQPIGLEAGLEGVWTPVVSPAAGYCEYNCNLCGQVCPTGAISVLSLAEKQKLQIGIARFNKDHCIPWYKMQDCLVCEEHCPTPEKAIRFDEREVTDPDGSTRTVKFPRVDEALCIGCGICENKCPVAGTKGIGVTGNPQQYRLSV